MHLLRYILAHFAAFHKDNHIFAFRWWKSFANSCK